MDNDLSNDHYDRESGKTSQATMRPTHVDDAVRSNSYHHADIPPRIYEEGKREVSSPYTPSSYPPTGAGSTSSLKEPAPGSLSHSSTAPLADDKPDTTLSHGVAFKGELTFDRFLRIDGAFEGELISQGKLHVGPSGTVKSNITMSEAIIEGQVEGNIKVAGRLELRSQAEVQGDIEAGTLSVDEGVTIVGNVCVTPSHDG